VENFKKRHGIQGLKRHSKDGSLDAQPKVIGHFQEIKELVSSYSLSLMYLYGG